MGAWRNSVLLPAAWLVLALPAGAQDNGQASPPAVRSSTAFCLFEMAPDGERRLWLNLGIVQYIDWRPSELRIFYGGGNLGSGHEYHLPASRDEARAFIERMQATAARCAGSAPPPTTPAPTSGSPGAAAFP